MANDKSLTFERKFGFEEWIPERVKKAFEFAEGYKDFISQGKTEREVVAQVEKTAQTQGFVNINIVGASANRRTAPVSAPDKIYAVNRGKSIILARFGQRPMAEGVKMILAHIDSPRIDLKPMPLYESEKIAWLKTQYYGGIKKYQWTALPLAIHGVIVLANGKSVRLNIGENEADPILMITDLMPHLSKKQMEKKLEEAVEGEEMNVVIGSKPHVGAHHDAPDKEKETVKLGILELLSQRYGITEEDLVSADLEIVPAGKARDLGFDASMIGGYGQDDRICAYAAIQSLLTMNDPEKSCLIVLTDKEETGSESNTGALSSFIPDFVSEMLFLENGTHDENLLRDCFTQTKALSGDVTVAFDPDYVSVFDPKNTARLGAGIAVEKYGGRHGKSGTSEASAEYLAEIRRVFNENNVLWQTGGLGKVDLGGGGTIAMFLARYNMDVVDAGPAILSMHAPFEISSKIDLYATFEAYKAFLK